MNKRDQHIVNSLRRWMLGDITQKEETKLDQQAQDDPFLREALEGYRQVPEGNHQERIDRMRQNFQAKGTDRKQGVVLLSMPYRIAAAAAVLLAVGLFWYLNPGRLTNDLAHAEKQEAPTKEQDDSNLSEKGLSANTPEVLEEKIADESQSFLLDSSVSVANELKNKELLAQAPQEVRNDASEVATRAESEEALIESNPNLSSAEVAKSELEAEEEALEPSARSTADAQPASPAPVATEQRKANLGNAFANSPTKFEDQDGARVITGQVLDRSGAPLDGVLVATPGDETGTITNINGQYEILLDSNAQKLEFQRTGYALQQIAIPNSNSFVRVTLDETASSAESLTTTRRAKKRQKNKANPKVLSIPTDVNIAQPRGGYKKYERHLNRILKYPKTAIEQGISGDVTLSFTINPDGRLTNILVTNGPGAGLHEEAVRLLQIGPKWEVTNGSQESISFSYRLKFTY